MAALAADAWVCRFPSLDIVQLPAGHTTCVAHAGAAAIVRIPQQSSFTYGPLASLPYLFCVLHGPARPASIPVIRLTMTSASAAGPGSASRTKVPWFGVARHSRTMELVWRVYRNPGGGKYGVALWTPCASKPLHCCLTQTLSRAHVHTICEDSSVNG